jgi:hypothetical protein
VPTYSLSAPPTEEIVPAPEPAAPPPAQPTATYSLSAPVAAQPMSTAPAQPATLPPAEYREAPPPPAQPQGQGPLDSILGPVGPWLQDRVDDVTQPGGLLHAAERQYRPAPPDAVPTGAGWGEDRYAAAGQAVSEGRYKDALGAAIQGNWGDVSPVRATNLQAQAETELRASSPEVAADVLPAQQPDPLLDAVVQTYRDAPFLNAFTTHMQQNPDIYARIATEGYTTPEGLVWQGPRAAYEYFQSGQSGLQRLGTDVLQDPVGTAADIASTALSAGGALVGKGALKTGLRVASRAIDVPGTMGLSEAVPGVLKGAGAIGRKTGLLSPSSTAEAERAGQKVSETGAALLGESRASGTLGGQPSMLSQPTRGITRLTTPSADLAYDVDPTYGVRVYDDAAAPTTWRTPTEADFGVVSGALREMNQADRHAVRGPWYDWGMRHQDAAGDDLIDPFAPDLPGGVTSGRNSAAHRRWVDEMADTVRRFDDPDGNRPVLYQLMNDWRTTFYERGVHPLTKRDLAAHRLQSIKNVLAEVPAHDNAWAKGQIARMEAQLKAPPGSIGHGTRMVKNGATLSFQQIDTERLNLLAKTDPKAFWKGQLGKGRKPATALTDTRVTQADIKRGLITPYKPRDTTPAHTVHAYENFLSLAEARLSNPALQRADVGAIRDRMQRAVGTAPGAQARAALDGMKDALDRSGILPGASAMPDADVELALTGWLKATHSFSIDTPPGGASLTPPVMGVYTPGSASEGLRMLLDDPTEEMLSAAYEVNGVLKRPWEELLGESRRMAAARAAARAQATGRPLSAPEAKALTTTVEQTKKLHPEYRGLTAQQLADMSDEELDRLTASTVGEQVARAKGFDPDKKRKLLALYDNFNAMLRSLILYSPVRGIAYPMMQVLGNFGFTNLIAEKRAFGRYNPVEHARVVRFMKDPEANPPPRIVRMREGYGLGRSKNLGIVSRDQTAGIYTWFSDPDRAPFTRALGKVLAPQPIKNWADGGDTLHRQVLYGVVFDPAVTRLKRSLPDWADEVFAEARVRTGMPLPLTKQQMADAIRHLEDTNPDRAFTPVQLREALVEAAGGSAAPNKTELFNAADRVHRLYREKLVELDKTAMANVNRVAFDPTETNLDTFLSRAFLFSWWNTRAARLYAEEIAKSPVMLNMFSRAVQAGEQDKMEGKPPWYANWIEFMRTPAGFATSLNPFTLSSTFLTFWAQDQPDEKARLTKLGELETMMGSNLFLAPILKLLLGNLGFLGQDYRRQDITGLARSERAINMLAEYVNREVHTFNATKEGNPQAVPNIDVNWFQNGLAAHLSTLGIPLTQEVKPFDPDRSDEAQLTYAVTDEILRRNPELAIPDAEGKVYGLELAVREAMANPDSEAYQAGHERWVSSLYNAPLTDKGGPLGVLAAAAKQFILPLQFQTQPSSRMDRWGRVYRDEARDAAAIPGMTTAEGLPVPVGMTPGVEVTAADRAMSHLPYQTPQSRDYDLVEQEYYGKDPQLKTARAFEKSIRTGDVTENVTPIDGITFTPDDIALLSKTDRNAIAGAWLQSAGFADANDAAWENARALIESDPTLANGMGWWQYAQQYPDGVWAAFDATAAVNPNVARIANDPEFQKTRRENPEEAEQVIRYLGKTIAGVKDSRYDFNIEPGYEGVVGGLDGTVGTWFVDQQAAGNSYEAKKIAEVQADLEGSETIVADLNAFRPGAGDEYVANLQAGSDRPIPYDAYQAGFRGPTSGGWTGSYVAWQAANPDGTIEQWAREDTKAYQRQRTIEVANELATGTYVNDDGPAEGAAASPTYAYVTVAPRQALYDADGRFLGVPQQEATLAVVSEFTDSSGKKWAVLQDNAGATYTAPTSGLLKAA